MSQKTIVVEDVTSEEKDVVDKRHAKSYLLVKLTFAASAITLFIAIFVLGIVVGFLANSHKHHDYVGYGYGYTDYGYNQPQYYPTDDTIYGVPEPMPIEGPNGIGDGSTGELEGFGPNNLPMQGVYGG